MSRYEDAVARKIQERAEHGLQKYGVSVERTDLSTLDWLRHAQEEAMDLAVYLERLIDDALRDPSDSGVNCSECGRPYGDEHGFPDLVLPNRVWEKISPRSGGGGLLCPSCICKRLHDAGLRAPAAFTSGPIVSVRELEMSTLEFHDSAGVRVHEEEQS